MPKTWADLVEMYGLEDALQQVLGGYCKLEDALHELRYPNYCRFTAAGVEITRDTLEEAVETARENPEMSPVVTERKEDGYG